MKITLIIILFSQFLFADIIGGEETKGYSPTQSFSTSYKLYNSLAENFYNDWSKGGDCSCTRIAPHVIITAGHCFSDAISSKLIQGYGSENQDQVDINDIIKVQFSNSHDTIVSKVFIHPKYLELSSHFFDKKMDVYKQNEDKKTQQKLLNELKISKTKTSGTYDIAIIITENPRDDFYPASFKEYESGQKVEIVGYGYKELESYITEVLTNNLGLYAKKASNEFLIDNNEYTYNGFTFKTRDQETLINLAKENTAIDRLMDENEKKHEELKNDRRKFVGVNKLISDLRKDVYSIKGKALSIHTRYGDSISQGDSGSGLLINRSGDRAVIGVTSHVTLEDFSKDESGFIISRFAKLSLKENASFIKKYLKEYK